MEYIKQFFEWLLKWLAGSKDLPPATPVVEPVPPTPAPIPSPNRQIKLGDTGAEVEKAQSALKALGFELDVDGEFGSQTEAVVKQFQEANKIGTTGIIGPQTATALYSGTAKGPIKLSGNVVSAAELARAEAKKGYQWIASGGLKSVAEKYLASVRKLIGVPTARFPWCAAFVFWCLRETGTDMSHLGTGAAYCPSWVAWAKRKGYWHPASEKSFTPRLGDILIFDWDDVGTEDAEHIGFVLSYDGGAYLSTAEGNTSNSSNGNGDSTALRTRHWDTVEGFIRIT